MKNKLSDPSQWVDLYGDAMFKFCLLRVKSESIAEDLVQDAFLGGLKNYASFKGEASEKSWLISILKHKIMDFYSRNSKDINFNQLVSEENGFNSFFEQQINNAKGQKTWGKNPSDMFDNEDFMKVLHNCLNNIPPKLSNVFTMREFDNISTDEICKVLNITETNLWVILHRARAGLKNCLEINWFK